MGNEQCPAVSPTALTVAMAHEHRRSCGPVPNVPAKAATFKDVIRTHDVLQILIARHHNHPTSGYPQWVKSRPSATPPGRSAPGGEADEIGGKADIGPRTSAFGVRAVVPATWSELRLLAMNGHWYLAAVMSGDCRKLIIRHLADQRPASEGYKDRFVFEKPFDEPIDRNGQFETHRSSDSIILRFDTLNRQSCAGVA